MRKQFPRTKGQGETNRNRASSASVKKCHKKLKEHRRGIKSSSNFYLQVFAYYTERWVTAKVLHSLCLEWDSHRETLSKLWDLLACPVVFKSMWVFNLWWYHKCPTGKILRVSARGALWIWMSLFSFSAWEQSRSRREAIQERSQRAESQTLSR